MGDDASPAFSVRRMGISLGQHKNAASKTAKPPARVCAPSGFALSPYAPLSWAAIVGRRTGGEEMLVMRPLRLSSPPLLLRWKGTPSPTQKQWITRNGFYAAKFWHPQKKKASTPLHRGPKCRCFAALSWGTGRSAASHAGDYATARCRQCVVQRENLWFSTLCTFSQRAKAESLETQRAVWGKNKGPSDRPGPSIQPYCCQTG